MISPLIDISKDSAPPSSIYFGGASWGGAFYIGVYKGLFERFGEVRLRQVHISGDSAGALWALGIVLGHSPHELDTLYRTQSERAAKEGYTKNSEYLRDTVDALLNITDDAHERLRGRFTTAVTHFPFKHVRYSSWTSRADLVDCLLATLHVPLYCSRIKRHHGTHVIDGAYSFSGQDLIHGDDTLFVGIDPNADITTELSTRQLMFPSVGKDYDDLVVKGYLAAMQWPGSFKAKVSVRNPNYAVLMILWPLKMLELIADYFVDGLIHLKRKEFSFIYVAKLLLAIYFIYVMYQRFSNVSS